MRKKRETMVNISRLLNLKRFICEKTRFVIDALFDWKPMDCRIDRLRRLQSVLKASARLVLRLPSHASVTDLMINRLHWLGFSHRITYKLCVLTYKSLRGNAPAYMLRHVIPVASVAGRAQLRSSSNGQLVVPFTLTFVMGGRIFPTEPRLHGTTFDPNCEIHHYP